MSRLGQSPLNAQVGKGQDRHPATLQGTRAGNFRKNHIAHLWETFAGMRETHPFENKTFDAL